MEQIEGITLSVSHYKDKDAILNILTRDGLVAVLGRSIFDQKKPLRVFTSPYLKAKFEIYKGKVGGFKLKDGEIIKFYNEDYLNFDILAALDFLSELTLKTIDGIDDYQSLYINLEITLDEITTKFNKLSLITYFLKILKLLGLKILINNFDDQLFSYKSGTFVTEEDPDAIFFNIDELIYINDVLNDQQIDYLPDSIDKNKLIDALNRFLECFTDIRLKSINLLI